MFVNRRSRDYLNSVPNIHFLLTNSEVNNQVLRRAKTGQKVIIRNIRIIRSVRSRLNIKYLKGTVLISLVGYKSKTLNGQKLKEIYLILKKV